MTTEAPPAPRQATRPRTASARKARASNNGLVIASGTLVFIAVGLALAASLVNLWPTVESGTMTGASPTQQHTVRLLFGAVPVKVAPGASLLLLVIVVGALGSLIHAATSFADFVGNRRFVSSWIVWYLMRLIVGLSLALLLYFAFRGGFFSGNAQASSVNPYGIAALAGLAGLFSKQATDKLREVFETLFRVQSGGGDAQRKDDLANAVPVVTRLDPPSLVAGAHAVKLDVFGDHFVKGASVVRVNGAPQDTEFVSAQQLTAVVPDELVAEAASLEITVFTGPPGGGPAKPVLLVVT
jgi:hypothetical protein